MFESILYNNFMNNQINIKNKALLYILFVPALDYLWMILSIGYLETGKYQWELMIETYFVGALPAYMLFIVIFIIGIKIGFDKALKNLLNVQKTPSNINKILIILLLIFMIFLMINIPFDKTYLDKRYINNNPTVIIEIYFWLLPYISLYLGYIYVNRRLFNKNIIYLLILINIICIVGLGNKYSLIVSQLSFFLLSYSIVVMSKKDVIAISTIFKWLVILVGSTFILYIYNKMNVDPDWYQNLLDRLFLLQGGIWWYAYNDYINAGRATLAGLIDYWNMFPNEKNISIGYFMQENIGLAETRNIIENHKSYYSGAFPAIFLIFSKNIIICLLMLLVYGYSLGYLYGKIFKNLSSGHIFTAFIIFSILLNLNQTAGNGDITFIFNINFYFKILLLIIILALKKIQK